MSNEKLKNRCGKKVYAVCVNYEGSVPEYSGLDTDDCLDIQQVAENIYDKLGDVKNEIALAGLDPNCLTLPTNNNTLKMFQFLVDTICTMQTTIGSMQDIIDTMQEQIQDIFDNNCPPAP